jgi:hypothetical protein
MGAASTARAICTKRECLPGTFGHWTDDPIPNFCERCGSPVISNCPECEKPVHELITNEFLPPPNFCPNCGEEWRRV